MSQAELVSQSVAAAALNGLLFARQNQNNWDFEDGDKMLRSFLDCIDIWAADVERQLRMLCAPNFELESGCSGIGANVHWCRDRGSHQTRMPQLQT